MPASDEILYVLRLSDLKCLNITGLENVRPYLSNVCFDLSDLKVTTHYNFYSQAESKLGLQKILDGVTEKDEIAFRFHEYNKLITQLDPSIFTERCQDEFLRGFICTCCCFHMWSENGYPR